MKVAKICVATIGGAFFVRSNWGALFNLEVFNNDKKVINIRAQYAH